jgi:hypothetical protein
VTNTSLAVNHLGHSPNHTEDISLWTRLDTSATPDTLGAINHRKLSARPIYTQIVRFLPPFGRLFLTSPIADQIWYEDDRDQRDDTHPNEKLLHGDFVFSFKRIRPLESPPNFRLKPKPVDIITAVDLS